MKCPECGSMNLKAYLPKEDVYRYNPEDSKWRFHATIESDEPALILCEDCDGEMHEYLNDDLLVCDEAI